MVEVAIKAEEFCLLWIPHWSTCMTKAEWASWTQVMVSAVAIFAAWKAVQAAHQLAIQSRRDERRTTPLLDNFRLVDKLYAQLHNLVLTCEEIAGTLQTDQKADQQALLRFETLARPVLKADYGAHPVDELVEPLAVFQHEIGRFAATIDRLDMLHRRRATSGYEEAVQEAQLAAAAARAQLPKFDGWLGRQVSILKDLL